MSTKNFRVSDGDWICPDKKCGNVNFARRTSCNRCGREKTTEAKMMKAGGTEIGKTLAEKSRGLFSANDWQCKTCGNVNWARRSECNMCNTPKYAKLEERTGYGGGFNERENVEYIEREESDGEYDEFGRKKKKYRGKPVGPASILKEVEDKESEGEEEEDEDEDLSKYKLDEDEDEDEADLSKYNLDASEEEDANKKKKSNRRSRSKSRSSHSQSSSRSSSHSSSRSRSSCSLALTDLTGQLLTSPVVIAVYQANRNWQELDPSGNLCTFFGFCMTVFGLCPLFIASAMAVERTLAIRAPHWYASHMRTGVTKTVLLSIWLAVFVFALLPIAGLGQYTLQWPGTWCFIQARDNPVAGNTFFASAFAFLGLCSLIVTMACNLATIKALVARCRTKPSASQSSRQWGRITMETLVQLLGIMCVLFACWSPLLVDKE
ncbi:Zinc finger Ran-binding domain-containing protein 2 [Chelonia mydas]|uniref:Prostaglandin E2 receptor EP3 subtype n=1 Tax=Chelonia mydas TaxID=8469 RepID=M7BA16_CHEMY|nr:Zinc finger Ran-binding domain-containing protein 2 [Chelonia mydas]